MDIFLLYFMEELKGKKKFFFFIISFHNIKCEMCEESSQCVTMFGLKAVFKILCLLLTGCKCL